MKLINLSKLAISALATMVIFGCGGGGGSSSGGGSSTPVVPKAVVTVAVQDPNGVLTVGQLFGTVDFILTLPAGVTVLTDGTAKTADGVVVPSGVAVGSTQIGNYTVASGPTPGTVRVVIAKVTGFGTGNFVTLNLDYSGADPIVSGFSINPSDVKVSDAASSSSFIAGLTTPIALQVIK